MTHCKRLFKVAIVTLHYMLLFSLPTPESLSMLKTEEPNTGILGKNEWLTDKNSKNCMVHGTKYQQVISERDCKAVTIDVPFCYGQCNSFFIPRYGEDFNSCNTCMPKKWNETKVQLNCKTDGEWKVVIKKVLLIGSCECQEVHCDKKKR
uniref:Gremlin-like 2 n=1 Tax=Hydra vulgaris TaxID=6087 RepID=Q2A123_HYDVU|nr:gremlin-2 [Hydra vulgaris]CAJ80869.1 Gremlin-like 2 precursor [Hydra vulgaris]